MFELFLQGRFFVLVGLDHLGDDADLGIHAGTDHQALAPPVGNQRAHEGRVLAVAQRGLLVQHRCGELVDRHRFTGQRSLLDLEIDAFNEAQVSRNVVPGFEQDDVTGNQLAPWDRRLNAIADHLRVWRRHLLERRQRLLRLRLLNHADHRVQDDDDHDRHRIDVLAESQ